MSYLKAKMHQFDFRWGSDPDPSLGAYSAPPPPQLYLRGPTSKESEGNRGKKREREGKGKERRRRGSESRGTIGKERGGFAGPMLNCFLRACFAVYINKNSRDRRTSADIGSDMAAT